MRNKLILFTNSFPFGKGEEFLKAELVILSAYWKEIILIPRFYQKGVNRRQVPSNCTIFRLEENDYHRKKVSFIQKLYLSQIWLGDFLRGKALISNIIKDYSLLLRASYTAEKIKRSKIIKPCDTCYSYWFGYWVLSLSLANIKKKYFMTRAHGYDLYEFRRKTSTIPYRKFCLNKLDAVITVSLHGANYLRSKYPEFSKKISHAYLGIRNDNDITEQEEIAFTRIVSCSSIEKVKQLHLIVEALGKVTNEVEWIHFGSGSLQQPIEKKAEKLGPNIRVVWKGHIDSKLILKYYNQNKVHLFVNVSSSEGLPVSIMEAISAGIPVFAPNIGGVSEIVNERTGILADERINPEILAQNIENAKDLSKKLDRNEIRKYYREKFSALKNFESLSNLIKNGGNSKSNLFNS